MLLAAAGLSTSLEARPLVARATPTQATPDDSKAARPSQQDRAQRRITELFQMQVSLVLADLARSESLSDDVLEGAEAAGHVAVATFMAAHPVKVKAQSMISRSGSPITHEPFSAFLGSDAWHAALGRTLDDAQRAALQARIEARRARVLDALLELIDVRVTRGLCLTDGERSELRQAMERAAALQQERGVIESPTQGFFNSGGDKDFTSLLGKAGFVEALREPRRELVKRIIRQGRTSVHDDWLEIEFLLEGRNDAEDARPILRGCAEALATRGGKSARKRSAAISQAPKRRKSTFWDKALRAVLDLEEGETLSALPGRAEDHPVEQRAEFFLAVLDQRLFFSEDQRESLLPLLREYAVEDLRRSRRAGIGLTLPHAFGLQKDGLVVPGDLQGARGSTKIRALVSSFHEACTPEQREQLGA